MSSSLLAHVISGDAFYSALLIVLLSALATILVNSWKIRIVAAPAMILGCCLLVATAVPMYQAIYYIWWISATVWFVALWLPIWMEKNLVRYAGIVLAVVCLLSMALELPFRVMPDISPQPLGPVYVLGDSLSAGVGSEDVEKLWPEIFAERTGVKVRNYSKPGAQIKDAINRCSQISGSKPLVIVEIGGNDLLQKLSLSDFRGQLFHLLSELQGRQAKIIMFELPLLPGYSDYGAAQRNLAATFEVIMIPRRVLTEAIWGGGGTLDGLHMSQDGHHYFCRQMLKIFGFKESDNIKYK
jgi:acyl-CoA thioesterase I